MRFEILSKYVELLAEHFAIAGKRSLDSEAMAASENVVIVDPTGDAYMLGPGVKLSEMVCPFRGNIDPVQRMIFVRTNDAQAILRVGIGLQIILPFIDKLESEDDVRIQRGGSSAIPYRNLDSVSGNIVFGAIREHVGAEFCFRRFPLHAKSLDRDDNRGQREDRSQAAANSADPTLSAAAIALAPVYGPRD